MRKIIKYVCAIVWLSSCTVYADNHLTDPRCCIEPARNKDGSIKRNRAVVEAFERLHPLPSGYSRDEWQVDHVIPLRSGGVDAVWNMQWLRKSIKTCPGTDCKDRWERKVYEVK